MTSTRFESLIDCDMKIHLEANKTAEYFAWKDMKSRCVNPRSVNWYGRGIAVCARWIDSYPNFLEDMGRKLSPLHTLERKDNSLGYSPDNCKWATRTEQSRNRRNNLLLTHAGKTLTAGEWASITGIAYSNIYARKKAGWDDSTTLTTLAHGAGHFIEFDGELLNAAEWARRRKIPYRTLVRRIEFGFTPDEILSRHNLHGDRRSGSPLKGRTKA